jgi:hypothetical protein
MNKIYYFYFFILILTAVILFGCSAASTSTRYQKENKDAGKGSAVRFTSEDNFFSADTLSYLDDEFDDDEEDDMPMEDNGIDIARVLSQLEKRENYLDPTSDESSSRDIVVMEIIKYLNTPYKFGGNSKDGIDCSAFTQNVFYNALSTPIHRTARDQFKQGITISRRDDLKFGDLVFFNTRRRVRPGHVGIYIGDNLFAHSSSKHGVIISSLEHQYYNSRYMGARRIETEFSQLQ